MDTVYSWKDEVQELKQVSVQLKSISQGSN